MLDARLWKDGVIDCEMWDGHCHGTKVVALRSVGWGRVGVGIRAKFSCHPVSQFCRQRHSFRTARLRWHSEEWRKSYASSIGLKEWLHDMETLFRFCHVGTHLQDMLASRRLVDKALARCLGIGYLERSRSELRSESVMDKLNLRYDMKKS
ncbi:hypothetical protein TIFTF001_048128 [Ficus carica]|uniref:Uncharacterized protein n=1 Tax=Ficus carica TaxID=3494 RepID=A0AA87ZZY9_FICCA|nr:hypothetical protein TIFTF001_048128 [Ficus carica]